MSQLLIEMQEEQRAFRPGDTIKGAAFWKRDTAPKSVEIRLFWHTRGKGTEDVKVVGKEAFPEPKAEEARPFQFRAPEGPYSFSGKLISLIWGLELVAEPGAESTRIELTISPSAREVLLPQT